MFPNWLFPTDVVNKLYLYILCIKSIFVLNNNLKILGEVGADAELIMMPIMTTVWLLLWGWAEGNVGNIPDPVPSLDINHNSHIAANTHPQHHDSIILYNSILWDCDYWFISDGAIDNLNTINRFKWSSNQSFQITFQKCSSITDQITLYFVTL